MYSHKYSELAPVCLHGAQKIMQLSGIIWHHFIDLCSTSQGSHLGMCSLLIQHSSGENHVLGFFFPLLSFFSLLWGVFTLFPCPLEILSMCELCTQEEREKEVGSQRCQIKLPLLHLYAFFCLLLLLRFFMCFLKLWNIVKIAYIGGEHTLKVTLLLASIFNVVQG